MLSKTSENPVFSIVVPVYQAAGFVSEFHARMQSVAQSLSPQCEIIYVDDGSSDATPQVLARLQQEHDSVTIITLSRNFGQFAATRTGLAHARGEYIYVTDCDLEEAPEWLGAFHAKMNESHADIVYGTQDRLSPQTLPERIGGGLMRFILKHFSDIHMVENYVSARLMRRTYLNAFLTYGERTGGFYILCQLTGFAQSVVKVEKSYKGSSSYSLRRKATMFIDHILSATSFPVTCLLWLAGIITAVGLVKSIGAGNDMQSVNGSVWLMGGLILGGVGVVGLYASRILMEAKQRPLSIIRSIADSRDNRS